MAFLIGLGPPTWVQRAHAACLAAGPDAALSHRAAAAHLELDGHRRGPVELTVPYRRLVDLPGVLTHRIRLLVGTEVRPWVGVPTTRI